VLSQPAIDGDINSPGNLLDRSSSIDHKPAVGGSRRHLEVTPSDSLMKLGPSPLDTVNLITQTFPSNGKINVEQHGEIRLDAVRGESHHVVENREIETSPVPLVGEGRSSEPVRDDRLVPRQGGPDNLGHMLRLVGNNQESLSPVVEFTVFGIEKDPANRAADVGGSELERERQAEAAGQATGLRRFPRSISAFECDQSSTHCADSSTPSDNSLRNAPDPARKLHDASTPAATMIVDDNHSVSRTPGT